MEGEELREWYDSLASFAGSHAPGYASGREMNEGDFLADDMPGAVRHAYDEALVSAFEAMKRLADRVAPASPAFTLDVTKAGKDS